MRGPDDERTPSACRCAGDQETRGREARVQGDASWTRPPSSPSAWVGTARFATTRGCWAISSRSGATACTRTANARRSADRRRAAGRLRAQAAAGAVRRVCEAHLAYAEKRRAYCHQDPKPFCAYCDSPLLQVRRARVAARDDALLGPQVVAQGHAIDGIKHVSRAASTASAPRPDPRAEKSGAPRHPTTRRRPTMTTTVTRQIVHIDEDAVQRLRRVRLALRRGRHRDRRRQGQGRARRSCATAPASAWASARPAR